MQNTFTVKKIEKEYQKTIQQQIELGNALTADAMIDLSIKLFHELKVKGVSITDRPDNDMLLFQYGINDWVNHEHGKHFSFEIARQFIKGKSQDFFQLRFTLIFEPEPFKNCASYNCWSYKFANLDEFVANIKSTEGYKNATLAGLKTYELSLTKI